MSDVIYRHRQSGRLIQASMFLALISTVILISKRSGTPGDFGILVAAICALVLWLFGSLSVIVTQREVMVSFGPGLIKRRIPTASILEAKSVSNSWLMGWGIRVIPNGFMFNVSGLQAVELELRSGSVFRIGTDEPERLEMAIRDAIRSPLKNTIDAG